RGLGDDGGATGGRHRAGPAGRGHRRAQARRPRGLRSGLRVLRLTAQVAPLPLMDPVEVPPSEGTATQNPSCVPSFHSSSLGTTGWISMPAASAASGAAPKYVASSVRQALPTAVRRASVPG